MSGSHDFVPVGLDPSDDDIHVVGLEPWWREAWYFEFFDPTTRVQFQVYQGVLCGRGRTSALRSIGVRAARLPRDPARRRGGGHPLWLMVEVPSVVLLIERFLPLVDGVSIGTNDLTQLVLGVDRDNPRLIPLWDEQDEAVRCAVERVARACRERAMECCVCGDAPSRRPEMAASLLQLGVTSLSVSPDAFERTARIVREIESRLT